MYDFYLGKGDGCDLNLNILPGWWVVSFTTPRHPPATKHTHSNLHEYSGKKLSSNFKL